MESYLVIWEPISVASLPLTCLLFDNLLTFIYAKEREPLSAFSHSLVKDRQSTIVIEYVS